MNKNKIEITIELQPGVKANLELSPENYKQNFRDFRKKYEIEDVQALRLKRIIQQALTEISKMKFENPVKTEISQSQQKQQVEQHNIESPRFKKMQADEQLKTGFASQRESQMISTQKKKQIQRQLPSEQEVPIVSVKDIHNFYQKQHDQEKIADASKVIIPNSRKISQQNEDQLQENSLEYFSQPKSEDQQHQENEYDPQPLPAVPPLKLEKIVKDEGRLPTGLKDYHPSLHSHKKMETKKPIKQKPKVETQKKHSPKNYFRQEKSQSDSGRCKFDRLYYQQTDSFKSKKNQEINRKQLLDFIEVQKYDLNNRLKRTTKDFFYQLHNRTTECWENKTSKSKEKSVSETTNNYSTVPNKKVSIDKAFKGSLWESRSRCQARIYQQNTSKQKAKADANLKAKQAQIRKRINKSKSKAELIENKRTQYRSRSCQKCSPKKVKTPKKTIKPAFKNRSKEKKSYVSNILIEAYQQRMRQVKALNNL